MGKVNFKPGNMLYPLPAIMVSVADKKGNDNILTVAWTGTLCSDPPMAYICIRPERHSYSMIMETGEFVINLTTERLASATDYCGVKSGREVDKFKEMNLTKEKAQKVKAPLIAECPVNIECKVKETKNLGSHTMFIADVVAVNVDDKYIDKTGKFNLNSSDLLVYSHGEYFGLGEKIGKFGYSVNKKIISRNEKFKKGSQNNKPARGSASKYEEDADRSSQYESDNRASGSDRTSKYGSDNRTSGSDRTSKYGSDNRASGSDRTSKYGSSDNRTSGSDRTSKYGSSDNRASGSDRTSKYGSSDNRASGSDRTSKYGSSDNRASGSDRTSKYGSSDNRASGSDRTSKYGSDSRASGSDRTSKYGSSDNRASGSDRTSKYASDNNTNESTRINNHLSDSKTKSWNTSGNKTAGKKKSVYKKKFGK